MDYEKEAQTKKLMRMYGYPVEKIVRETSQDGLSYDEWLKDVKGQYSDYRNQRSTYKAEPQPKARGNFVDDNGKRWYESYKRGVLVVEEVVEDYDQYRR